MKNRLSTQVLIIGGGVIGTACAYFLAKRGVKVLVLERSHLGAGASGTTASIVSIGGSSSTPKPLQPLNVESYHLILDAEQDFERSLETIRGGILYTAMNEQEALELHAFDKEIRRMGIDCTLMDGPEARRQEPDEIEDRVKQADRKPGDHSNLPNRRKAVTLALRRSLRLVDPSPRQ